MVLDNLYKTDGGKPKIRINLSFLLFVVIININIFYVNSNQCKEEPSFNNERCFNRLHIFNHERFRGGHFSKQKMGICSLNIQ